jgi:5'-3' exonuclease
VLRGDPSDGLPGIPRRGEKTAAALVRTFGTVQAMLAAIDAGHGGFPMNSGPSWPPRATTAAWP